MKGFKYWILGYLIYSLLILLLITLTDWDNDTKDLVIQFSLLFITGLGFIFGIQQVRIGFNQYLEEKKKEFENFLDLSVSAKKMSSFYSIKTQVLNKSAENKAIDYSFLLICKQEEDIVKVFNNILNKIGSDQTVDCSNDFNIIKEIINESTFLENKYAIVPLDFYFSENIRIGNESPSYTYSFDLTNNPLENGIYTVRFFIYPEIGFHRSTADNLIISDNLEDFNL